MAKIAVYLHNQANRSLICRHLEKAHEVLDMSGNPSLRGNFDLAIVDIATIRKLSNEIKEKRLHSTPLILPFMLTMEPGGNPASDPFLGDLVDDVLYFPVKKAELDTRVENLLRLHFLSVKSEEYSRFIKNDLERVTRALRIARSGTRSIVQTGSESELLEAICTILVQEGPYEYAWIGYSEGNREASIRKVARAGNEPDFANAATITSWPGETVPSSGSSIIIHDVAEMPQYQEWRDAVRECGYRSACTLPVHNKKEFFGLMEVYSSQPDVFSEDELDILEQLAVDLAFGIRVKREFEKRRKDQKKIYNLAYYDSLTKLLNRKSLMDNLQKMAEDGKQQQQSAAALFIDLDNFKMVNDTIGHHFGDELLKEVAKRLEKTIREPDFAARHGGDEFVIVISAPQRNDRSKGSLDEEHLIIAAEKAAQRIIAVLEEPFNLNGYEHKLHVSIGISLYPYWAGEIRQLLEQADMAMYKIKKEMAGSNYLFFQNEMSEEWKRRFSMESELNKAVKDSRFVLHYQPLIDLQTGILKGVEALIRWPRLDGSLIAPGDFLPVAIETGLIVRIGDWVLREALDQLKHWLNQGVDIFMAVNVSEKQIIQPEFVENLLAELESRDIPKERLKIELTEEAMLSASELIEKNFQALSDQGVGGAIDDFGTGYSSLSRLNYLPLSILKIDKSFVGSIDAADSPAPIVKTIVQLADNLDLQTVAEGIENEVQYNYLKDLGCDLGQGFHLARPEPASELSPVLEKRAAKLKS